MAFLTLSDDTLLTSLTRYNPWWKDQEYSFHLKKKRFYFEEFKKLALNTKVHRAVILMGPRRVGKTVMLRQLINDALKQKIFSSRNILFVSVDDPIYSHLSLEDFISLFQKKTKSDTKTKKLIIFDEIQYLKNWEQHLKVLIDKYSHIKFVVSGSAAAALRRQSKESGVGRFTDFFLPPLMFREFCDFFRVKLKNNKLLNKTLIEYINFGGYPEPIFNEDVRKNFKKFVGSDIIDKVLLKDLPSLYGIQDTQELNRLFTMVAFNSGQEINLESLSKKSNITKNTIQKYLTYLESAFLIKRVYRIDGSGKRFKRERNFKVYLTNPSMYATLFGEVKDTDDLGSIMETVLFSQCFHSDLLSRTSIYYARWKKDNTDYEVDLVKTDERYSHQFLLEIKWSDRHLDNITGFNGLFEMAVKSKLDKVFISSKTKSDEREVVYKENRIKVIFYPLAVICYHYGEFFFNKESSKISSI